MTMDSKNRILVATRDIRDTDGLFDLNDEKRTNLFSTLSIGDVYYAPLADNSPNNIFIMGVDTAPRDGGAKCGTGVGCMLYDFPLGDLVSGYHKKAFKPDGSSFTDNAKFVDIGTELYVCDNLVPYSLQSLKIWCTGNEPCASDPIIRP